MSKISCEQNTLGKNSKSILANRHNKKTHWNISLGLRGLIIVAVICMMVLAPSAVDAKSDNGKKLGHEKSKNNNGKTKNVDSTSNSPVKLEINLGEYSNEENESFSCDPEKPCFLNLFIKYDNQILEDTKIIDAYFIKNDYIRERTVEPIHNINYDYRSPTYVKQIQNLNELENELEEISEDESYLDIKSIGKNSFKLKNLKNEILGIYNSENYDLIKNNKELKNKFSEIEYKYVKTINQFKTSIQEYQKNNDLTITKRLLINEMIKDNQIFNNKISKIIDKQVSDKFVKAELDKINTQKQFRNILIDIAIEHDDKKGFYDNDEILITAIEKSIELESWNIVDLALNEIHERQTETHIKNKISNLKKLIDDEVQDIKNIEKQPQSYLLTSKYQSQISEKFGENKHQIMTKNLLKSIIKNELKDASKDLLEFWPVLLFSDPYLFGQYL